MTLEQIRKGLGFADEAWEHMTEKERKELAYIVIEVYQKACNELLKMIEERNDGNEG